MSYMLRSGICGAGGQTRTGTRFPSPDFKSGMSTNSITPARNPRLGQIKIIQRSLQLKSNHKTISLDTQEKSQTRNSPFKFSLIFNTGFQFLIPKCTLTFDALTTEPLSFQRLFEEIICYILLEINKPILVRPASDNRLYPTKQRHSGFEYPFDSQSVVDALRCGHAALR